MDQQSFKLSLAAAHHINSFNYCTSKALEHMLTNFSPMELFSADLPPEHKQLPFSQIKITFTQLKIGQPYRFNDPTAVHQEIYPQECRLAGKTYSAPLLA